MIVPITWQVCQGSIRIGPGIWLLTFWTEFEENSQLNITTLSTELDFTWTLYWFSQWAVLHCWVSASAALAVRSDSTRADGWHSCPCEGHAWLHQTHFILRTSLSICHSMFEIRLITSDGCVYAAVMSQLACPETSAAVLGLRESSLQGCPRGFTLTSWPHRICSNMIVSRSSHRLYFGWCTSDILPIHSLVHLIPR